MAELDRFEARFAAAYRRYLDEVPTEVDVAAVARAASLQPRARRIALPWTLRPVPAFAWLVLVGLVVTALVAAALFVGSQRPSPVGFTCPAGTDPDKPGPVDQARPVIGDGIASMVFDRHAGRIVLLAQVANGPETWTFDVCANTWTRMHPDREPGPSSPATHLIYDVDSDATIAIDGVSTWVYDLAADTWTRKGATPVVRQWNHLTWTYDHVSGLVFAADAGELWSYDVETDTWALISEVPWPAGRASLAYDASVDRIVAYADSRDMWRFDIRAGTWSKSGGVTPDVHFPIGWPNPGVVYDEAAERTVVSATTSVAYDAAADRWESLGESAGPFAVYDSLNRRFLGLDENRDGVLAFDLAVRERIVLLEASEGQPVP